MHMNQMYFSALNRGRGELKKYAIVQQMQKFKKEIQGTMEIKYILNLKTVMKKKHNKGLSRTVRTKLLKPTNCSWGLTGEALRPEIKATVAVGCQVGSCDLSSKSLAQLQYSGWVA